MLETMRRCRHMNHVFITGQRFVTIHWGLVLAPPVTLSRRVLDRGFSKSTPAQSQSSQNRLIKTLNPKKMVEVGQKLHRFTAPLHLYHIREDQPLLSLYTTNLRRRSERWKMSLPENTSGVFYYHQEPGMPQISGHVRFRLCDDVSRFEEGQDINYRPYIPWSLHSSRVFAHDEARKGIAFLLLQEGHVNEKTVDSIKSLWKGQHLGHWLFRFDQPFYFDLSQQKIDCSLVSDGFFYTFHLPGLRDYRLDKPLRGKSPYSGVVRARLELSGLPEHQEQGPTLVLRILETLTPVLCMIPNYDEYWARPAANTLTSRLNPKSKRDRPTYKPWTYQLDSQPDGGKIKQFIRLTSPEVRI